MSLKKIASLIQNGIEVDKAHFHAAVNNGADVPENQFNSKSDNRSRRVDMWLTTRGLVCQHNGRYFLVPDSNIIFLNFKDDEERISE